MPRIVLAKMRHRSDIGCDVGFPRGATALAEVLRSRYGLDMETAAKLLEEAMQLPEDEREELAAKLLDSLEGPRGISIDDKEEIEKRVAEARSGAPGIA